MSFWHDPNKHDSPTLILTSVVALLLGIAIGCLITYHALT